MATDVGRIPETAFKVCQPSPSLSLVVAHALVGR